MSLVTKQVSWSLPRVQREYTRAFGCLCQRQRASSHPALHGNLNWTPLCVYTKAKIWWMFCYLKVSADILFPSLFYLNIWDLVSLSSPPLTLQKAGHETGSQQVKPTQSHWILQSFLICPSRRYSLGTVWPPANVPQWETPSQTDFNYAVRAKLPLPWAWSCVQAHPHGAQQQRKPEPTLKKLLAQAAQRWATQAPNWGPGSRTASPAPGLVPLFLNASILHSYCRLQPSSPVRNTQSEKPPHYRYTWERRSLSLETHLTTDPELTVEQRGQWQHMFLYINSFSIIIDDIRHT